MYTRPNRFGTAAENPPQQQELPLQPDPVAGWGRHPVSPAQLRKFWAAPKPTVRPEPHPTLLDARQGSGGNDQ